MIMQPTTFDRFGRLIDLCTCWAEMLIETELGNLAQKNPQVATRVHERCGPDFSVRPVYDIAFLTLQLEKARAARDASVRSLNDAFDECETVILAVGPTYSNQTSLDCATLAQHQHSIRENMRCFHLHAAQVECAFQSIMAGISFEYVCDPDPCALAPLGGVTPLGTAAAPAVQGVASPRVARAPTASGPAAPSEAVTAGPPESTGPETPPTEQEPPAEPEQERRPGRRGHGGHP